MAEEVEMTPVEAAEPPKADPLASPAEKKPGAATEQKPGLRLPAQAALKPGLKLPTQTALKPGLKLPPKPGAATALKPGLKLPTQTALKPGLKLPTKPVIRKPGSATAAPLPKPLPKPVAADDQGPATLPTVEAKAVPKGEAEVKAAVAAQPNPLEALKSVTQKMKGLTQEIPQQAVLHKTGIIAEGEMSVAQKEAAKHKTSRISLSDAMGVAPVKNENAPMKTIRIKRPVGIPSAGQSAASPVSAATEQPTAMTVAPETATATQSAAPAASTATITQRKTLKISRPGTAVRPSGKFGVRRPGSQATTVVAKPSAVTEAGADAAAAPVGDIADIPDIPSAVPPVPSAAAAKVTEGPAWLWTLSSLVQAAACVAIGALAWFLYQNTLTAYF